MWKSTLDDVQPLKNLDALPQYVYCFVWANLGPFQIHFLALTLCAILCQFFRFLGTWTLSQVLSNYKEMSDQELFYWYLPAWLAFLCAAEGGDYFIRRYGEAFPQVFTHHLKLRFYLSMLDLNNRNFINFSKEKLLEIYSNLESHVKGFFEEWFWGTSRKLFEVAMVVFVLGGQGLWVLGTVVGLFGIFLVQSFYLSGRISVIAKRLTEVSLGTGTTIASLVLNLNIVQRLGLKGFFERKFKESVGEHWRVFEEFREYHSFRWLLQLNIFNLIYISTISYTLIQVRRGEVPIGQLVLVKSTFDSILGIVIYLTEKRVAWIQQREDFAILRKEFKNLGWRERESKEPAEWGKEGSINFSDVVVQFSESVQIRVPTLKIQRGDKIGIIGESGMGKTTILNVLLNSVDYSGSVQVSGKELKGLSFSPKQCTHINSSDPLYKISLRENLVLGASHISDEKVKRVLEGVRAMSFISSLDVVVGSSEFNLSTGQEQRIRLARGLLQETDIVLMDEPFNGIDGETKVEIMDFIRG